MSGTKPPPLLQFAVTSTPDPIRTSEAEVARSASLIVVASNPNHHGVEVEKLAFEIPVGSAARDLATSLVGAAFRHPKGWQMSVESNYVVAVPVAGRASVGGTGLVFTIAGLPINDQAGSTTLTIYFQTVQGNGSTKVALAKFPAGFDVPRLQATPTSVTPGIGTRLSWAGGPGTYTLSYGDTTVTHVKGEPNEPLPSSGEYDIDGLVENTTFTLSVTTQSASGPLTARSQATVTVDRVHIVSFDASPMNPAVAGDPVTLSWATMNATSVELHASDASFPTEVPVQSNAHVVQPQQPTTYTLRAHNPSLQGGDSRTIRVGPSVVPGWNELTAQGPWSDGLSSPQVLQHNWAWWIVEGSGRVWRSTDGAAWSRMPGTPPWAPLDSPSVATHDGRIWVMAGMRPGHGFMNAVWSSADGTSWKQESTPRWQPRCGAGLVEYQDTLWLMGGVGGSLSAMRMLNDVWRLDNGEWTEVIGQANWEPRGWMSPAVFEGRLWIFGGGSPYASKSFADAWTSVTGATWGKDGELPSGGGRVQPLVTTVDGTLWLGGGVYVHNLSINRWDDLWTRAPQGNWNHVTNLPMVGGVEHGIYPTIAPYRSGIIVAGGGHGSDPITDPSLAVWAYVPAGTG